MKEVEILLVEDNKGDVILAREALLHWQIKNKISAVGDGDEAIRYLKATVGDSSNTLPDLVIMDINLPKIDGKQVLEFIRTDADLQHLPVVIFSSSVSDKDVADAIALKADLYLQKPCELQPFFDAVHTIEHFWLNYKNQCK